MTLARSCGLLRPAKVILVPGANFFGLGSHSLRLSQFQVPPLPASASEKAKPVALADRLADHAPQVRAERVGAALVGIVAGGALLEDLLALGRIGAGEIEFDRLARPRRRLRLRPRRPRSDSPSSSGRSLWNISPATIDEPSATMPANSTQPAMVLKRSSMRFPCFSASRDEWICAALYGASRSFFKPPLGRRSRRGRARARRRGDRASAARPREAVERMPPALADRARCAADDRKFEREMGEDVADGAERVAASAAARRVHSLPGSAAIPPSMPLAGRRTSQTCAVALDPLGDAVLCGRARRFGLGAGKASGVPLANAAQSALSGQPRSAALRGRQIVAPRSIIAWAKSPAARRASSPATSRSISLRRRLARVACEPRDHPLDIGVDRRGALAERDRGDRGGGIGADAREACEAPPRCAGKPPRAATSRAQAIRLRARA